MDMNTLLAQNTVSTNTETQADKNKQIAAVGMGQFGPLVENIKTYYTKDYEKATAAATKGLPVRELSKWDAEYLSYLFDVHPEVHEKFATMMVLANNAVKRGKDLTGEELQALNALRAIAGGKKEEILKFMTMIRDASKMVEEREAQGKPSQWKVERIEKDQEKKARKDSQLEDTHQAPGATLRDKGVKVEDDLKGSDVAGALAFLKQKSASQYIGA